MLHWLRCILRKCRTHGLQAHRFGQSIRGACPACAPSIMTKCICCNNLCCNMCMAYSNFHARIPHLPGSTQPSCRECYKNLCEGCCRSAPGTLACGRCKQYHFEFCPEVKEALTCHSCKRTFCGNCAFDEIIDFKINEQNIRFQPALYGEG